MYKLRALQMFEKEEIKGKNSQIIQISSKLMLQIEYMYFVVNLYYLLTQIRLRYSRSVYQPACQPAENERSEVIFIYILIFSHPPDLKHTCNIRRSSFRACEFVCAAAMIALFFSINNSLSFSLLEWLRQSAGKPLRGRVLRGRETYNKRPPHVPK